MKYDKQTEEEGKQRSEYGKTNSGHEKKKSNTKQWMDYLTDLANIYKPSTTTAGTSLSLILNS